MELDGNDPECQAKADNNKQVECDREKILASGSVPGKVGEISKR